MSFIVVREATGFAGVHRTYTEIWVLTL